MVEKWYGDTDQDMEKDTYVRFRTFTRQKVLPQVGS